MTFVAVLHFITTAFLFLGALLFVLAGLLQAVIFDALIDAFGWDEGGDAAAGIILAMTLGIAILLAALGTLFLLLGRACLRGRPWGRIVSIVLAVLGLLSVPASVAYAIADSAPERVADAITTLVLDSLILWALLSRVGASWFLPGDAAATGRAPGGPASGW